MTYGTELLCGNLPDNVQIGGGLYPLYTDFRNWIKIECILEKNPTQTGMADALILCYKRLPPTIADAAKGLLWFYGMGKEHTKKPRSARTARAYSFLTDGAMLYSGFLKCYGIDLSTASLHWWQFRALMECLEDCRFAKAAGYRCMDLSNVKSKTQKEFYRRMKRLYRLPDTSADAESVLESLF